MMHALYIQERETDSRDFTACLLSQVCRYSRFNNIPPAWLLATHDLLSHRSIC